MITIIDSGVANIGSLVNSFNTVEVATRVADSPDEVAASHALVLPGVGAFADAMDSLRGRGLDSAISQAVSQGAWILGICLGMQLLMETSDEFGLHRGLSLLEGRVVRLPYAPNPLRIPNIGWRCVSWSENVELSPAWSTWPSYYFAHSFYVQPERPEQAIARMPFGDEDVAIAVQSNRVLGVQFHPEKSQAAGLDLLKSFAKMASK